MSLIIKKADGANRAVAGYLFSKKKLDGAKLSVSKYSQQELPPKVDMREEMTSIENQGELNSCVANAVAGAYEYLAKRYEGFDYDVSRLFIYYNARFINDTHNKDDGAYVADAIEGLKKYGACSEETYPYHKNKVNKKPSKEAYDEAYDFLVESTERVAMNLNAWKSALAEGYPIIFGLLLFESFENHRKRGLIPIPSDKETSRDAEEGHAMLCVGYSDQDQVFIVRNSWGKNWGDKGYCYIPYRYVINEKFNLGDSWIIKQLDYLEDQQDYWFDDEESILSTIDSEIAAMNEDDYLVMCEEMGNIPLEQRIALILMEAASADDHFSDEEYEEIADYLDNILDVIGIDANVSQLLRNTIDYLGDEELLDESIELLGAYLSKTTLAQTILDVEELISVDELEEDEENFVDYLIQCWQIEDTDFEEAVAQFEDDEEDYDDDEEYDEDDEEYDEDEDDEEE